MSSNSPGISGNSKGKLKREIAVIDDLIPVLKKYLHQYEDEIQKLELSRNIISQLRATLIDPTEEKSAA